MSRTPLSDAALPTQTRLDHHAGFCIFPLPDESIGFILISQRRTFSDGKRQGRLFSFLLTKFISPDCLSATDAAVLWSGSLTSIRFWSANCLAVLWELRISGCTTTIGPEVKAAESSKLVIELLHRFRPDTHVF
jgi:hypothetical protein